MIYEMRHAAQFAVLLCFLPLGNEGTLVVCHGRLSSWWELMRFFNPCILLMAAETKGQHQRSVDEQGNSVTNKPLPDYMRTMGPEVYSPVELECSELGLVASLASARRLITLFGDPNPTQGDLQKALNELQGRLVDELIGRYFLALTPAEADLFENWRKGWEAISDRFPEIIRDVEEMNKCLALGRYSGAMFHALHVAEWGAISLGKFIEVSDLKEGWGPTERKLRELVSGGHAKLPAVLAGKFDFLEQMNREINSLVLAWRHKVDHAANHLAIVPNIDFTPDIAEHVIGAIRIFMLRLMEGLPATVE